MHFPFGEYLTVERYTTNAHGENVLSSTHRIGPCMFLIRSSHEPLDTRTDIITTATVIAPYGANLTALDRVVRADGSKWDIDGAPSNVDNDFTGWKAGQRSTAVLATG